MSLIRLKQLNSTFFPLIQAIMGEGKFKPNRTLVGLEVNALYNRKATIKKRKRKTKGSGQMSQLLEVWSLCIIIM